jgi:tetratricopeptide (TPR) repeat protein
MRTHRMHRTRRLGGRPLVSRKQTFAELRAVKRGVSVVPPGEQAREPYVRERLCDGEGVQIRAGGLAWLRRDGGATLLVAGPADLVLRAQTIDVTHGKVFVDTPPDSATELATPRGLLHLVAVRASLEISREGALDVYVLRGAVRSERGLSASPGERLAISADGESTKSPVTTWQDWTGGLATTDRAATSAPYGVGTVGARRPEQAGQPRFPLAIQRMDVRVTIEEDFAITEVDQTFGNPSADTVEGIYTFRTPPGATLHRFGIDRAGELVWARVQERQAAAAQYEANVYAGSAEDPALLEWDAPGVYRARLYPIKPHESRRVVTRYAEWLGRQGARGERRLYIYPMAAEGAAGSLPRIEELTIALDLERAHVAEARVGMQGKQIGSKISVKACDLIPRADLAVELFDDGPRSLIAYRAPHTVDHVTTAPADQPSAEAAAQREAGYLLLPVRPTRGREPKGGLDLAIVIDTSAATAVGALAIARATTAALLAHIGPEDRAAVWAGDSTLREVAPGSDKFALVDAARRDAIAAGLARIERGGATDLGALVADAASRLDAAQRGAVVYIGDGQPTVGEMVLPELRARLQRLPRPVRVFGIGIGDNADLALLGGICQAGFAVRVEDAHAAAESALRVLEMAERSVWLGIALELGPGIDRVMPRELGMLVADESTLVIGRIVGELPKQLVVRASSGVLEQPISVRTLNDQGDLQRRWAERRIAQLLEDDAGRAAVVEVGTRSGIITPFTSLYVPTAAEHARDAARAPGPEARAEAASSVLRWLLPAKPGEPNEVAARSGGGNEGRLPAAARMHRESAKAALSAAAAPSVVAEDSSSRHKDEEEAGAAYTRERFAPRRAQEMSAHLDEGAGGMIGRGALGSDPMSALGALMGDQVGAGLGLRGTGVTKQKLAREPLSKQSAQAALRRAAADGGDTLLARELSAKAAPPAGRLLAAVGHEVTRCWTSADLPFSERVLLWRERLANSPHEVVSLIAVYDNALRFCEAPSWRERTLLLSLIVDELSAIRARVAVLRHFVHDPPAAEVVYRALLTRVKSAADLRELHEALGLRRIDPEILDKALGAKQTGAERLALLRGSTREYPDDLELALRLLDAYEDAQDTGNGRALARSLRLRSDASTHVRTAVGEYYLRLAEAGRQHKLAAALIERDQIEARRTFGEIVEFAPADPLARRLLGDLLRAHGWYEEALRQYQTLARLVPDDASASLLMAAAAQGLGRTEEAVRWTEQAAKSGALDGQSELAQSSRSLASVFLAWARDEATRAGRKHDVERLRERARRLGAGDATGTVRLFLTWAHPELRPEFWSNALGSPMPAAHGDPSLGIAETALLTSRAGGYVEIHLQQQDALRAARLAASATLTAILDEGSSAERIVRLPISFRAATDGAVRAQRRFSFESGTLHEVML